MVIGLVVVWWCIGGGLVVAWWWFGGGVVVLCLREMASEDCVLSLGSSDPTIELSRWRVMTHTIPGHESADRDSVP